MKLLPAHAAPRPPLIRVLGVPVASTLAGSAVAALPLLLPAPVLPSFGLLMLLAWRLLRPEMWAPWIAVPLGLADDLLTGNPLGAGMASWTLILLALGRLEELVSWRDHWADWLIAAVAIQLCALANWLLAGVAGGHASLTVVAPQVAAAILCYPAVMRLVAILDRWRLRR